MTGMLLVYMNCRGHLMPCPLILPNDSGISTFIACAYIAIANTRRVAPIVIRPSIAPCPSPDVREDIVPHKVPTIGPW